MEFLLNAVIGKPILHSLSPTLHRSGMEQLRINGTYIRLAAESAAEAITILREMQATGCNVTAPFKEEAFLVATSADEAATRLNAANTLKLTGNGVSAFNTDVLGVQRCVVAQFPQSSGQKAVVLGTGGAARAALLALCELEWDVTVVGRNPERLEMMTKLAPCQTCSFQSLSAALSDATILVSCVTGDEQLVPSELLSPKLTVLDAVYGRDTLLLRAARERGCRIIPGVSWLHYQGCEAFLHLTERPLSAEALSESLTLNNMANRNLVTLIGAMGSGKSTVGELVAKELDLPFLDLDEEIQAKEGKSIAEIFHDEGEPYFRDCESRVLLELGDRAVIAAGGGTVIREANRTFLSKNSLNIWLWASADELAARLKHHIDRPLLSDQPISKTVAQILAERLPLYATLSDLVVPTGRKSPEEIAKRICYEIRSTRNS